MNIERLKELLFYNHETGVFFHRTRRTGVPHAGSKAGCINESRGISYERIKIDGKAYKSHRLAWLYVYGELPEGEVDHINGNTLDNRIANLRDVTRRENCMNKTKRADNSSGVTGVSKQNGKWVARISHNKKRILIGSFDSLEAAKESRKEAEVKYGYHSNHGRNKADALPPTDS